MNPPSVLRFVVPGEPVPAQPAAIVNGYVARKGRARQRAYRDHVRIHTIVAVNAVRWRSTPDDRYSVVLRAFLGNLRVIDCDNIAKSSLDGIKTIAFPDDRQIVDLHIYKRLDADHPRLEVEITRLPTDVLDPA